jgi:hypothetical protein
MTQDEQDIIDALFIVIDEFENNPIPENNGTLIEILHERIETIKG